MPTYRLAEAARRDLKVVLSGEGGDELFAGYGRYRKVLRPRLLGGGRMRAKGTFDGLGVLRSRSPLWRAGLEAAWEDSARPGRSLLQQAQASDIADWLPNDLLIKLDRCLMAHGVEGRVPFLDPHVADVAFRLSDRLKLRDGRGKYLLRRWLHDALPQADAFSAKRGFTVPVGAWIASRADVLGPLVARQPAIAEIADGGRVAKLFAAAAGKREGFAAWTLLFYGLWHRRHVEGLDTRGMNLEQALGA